MDRPDSKSANYAAQNQPFPLMSDVKGKEQSRRTSQSARTGCQNQTSVTPQENSRLDELIFEEDIEWGE